MKIYSFEKSEAWQHARKLAVWIYGVTAKFPEEEKYLKLIIRKEEIELKRKFS